NATKSKREAGSRPAHLRPRDPRTDVKIAGDWLDRWLPELDEVELRAYLQIAHFYNTKTYHDASELDSILAGTKRSAEQMIARLEKLELLEVIRHEGKLHYHFPFRDA